MRVVFPKINNEAINNRNSYALRFHGKEEVKEGGRYHMSLELDQKLYHMARLEISKVITGDKGEYRAVAKNKHGEGVATINLNFEGSGKPKYCIFYNRQHKKNFHTSQVTFFNLSFSVSRTQDTGWKITKIPEKTNDTTRRRYINNGMYIGSESCSRYYMVSGRKNHNRFFTNKNVTKGNCQRFVCFNIGNK